MDAKVYSRILVALDNSRHARRATAVAIEIARVFEACVVGVHVTNPGLHSYAFRQMEDGLPEEYRDEGALQKQREVHATMIGRGLEAISDSYLRIPQEAGAWAGVDVQTKILKGRHYEELAREIAVRDYDLAVFGAHGQGRCSRSLIGSVAERVVRRIRADALIVRDRDVLRGGRLVVGVDGSDYSDAAVRKAIVLARSLGMALEAVHVFNPQFHHAIFAELVGVLTEEAREVFNLERQQALHERVIDRGLEEVGKQYLRTAEAAAGCAAVDIETRVLCGTPFAAILDHVQQTEPALLVVGRLGRHRTPTSDIGSTAENLVRLAPCHVLVVGRDAAGA